MTKSVPGKTPTTFYVIHHVFDGSPCGYAPVFIALRYVLVDYRECFFLTLILLRDEDLIPLFLLIHF